MENEIKTKGKLIVLKRTTYDELKKLKLEYAYFSEENRTFDNVIRYLMDHLKAADEKVEDE